MYLGIGKFIFEEKLSTHRVRLSGGDMMGRPTSEWLFEMFWK